MSTRADLEGLLVWESLPEIIGVGIATGHAGIDRSLRFMVKNFHRPIQLADLVKSSGMSRRGLHKAFAKTVGVNPGAALRHVRIEYAKQLLIKQDLKLKQIARQCGFRSENTFCVAFRRAMRIAPKQYQRTVWLTERRHQQKFGIPPLRLFATNRCDHLHSFART